MSSFQGANTDVPPNGDLQLAPTGAAGPNFEELKSSFEKCITDSQPFVDQCRANYFSRYALWTGQSSDGKKHSRAGSGNPEVIPWDGASDLRVYEIDAAINRKAALYRLSFKRANLVASPIGGDDFKRSRIVSNFMRWLIHTQIPDVDREIELLANYILEKGVAATGQFWETKQEKTLTTVTIQGLQEQFPQVDIMAVMMDEEASGQIAAYFEERYGCTATKAKKIIKALLETGKTTVATLGRAISRPVLRAFALDEQLFIPPDTTDIEKATGIWRIEYFTPEALRAMVHSDGWDNEWVEKAIETCRGKLITLTPSEYQQPISRSMIYQQQRFTDQIGVVYGYQRLSDEDGVPGIYLTIFNPLLPPDAFQKGYAKFSLLEYAHGNYPFVLFRREFLSRRLHDSRGIPEPGKSWQDAIKAHRDSRIDAASIAIIPPIGYPMGRAPSRWGPGARIPERRSGEYHFMDKPSVDGLTEQSEEILTEGWKAYNGFASAEGDQTFAVQLSQNEVDRFLSQLSKAFNQCFDLYQQYGDDRITFRVIGMRDANAVEFVKGDPNERFDFYLNWDAQSGDLEQMALKWKAILEGIQLLNREGNVNFAESLQAYVESIDPVIAERILDPTQVGRDRVIQDEQNDLAQIFAGVNKPIKIGTPPQLALETIQNYVQNAPDVQQRLQADEAFRGRMEARMKQYQMQQKQEENKMIGVYGAKMPGQPMQ